MARAWASHVLFTYLIAMSSRPSLSHPNSSLMVMVIDMAMVMVVFMVLVLV